MTHCQLFGLSKARIRFRSSFSETKTRNFRENQHQNLKPSQIWAPLVPWPESVSENAPGKSVGRQPTSDAPQALKCCTNLNTVTLGRLVNCEQQLEGRSKAVNSFNKSNCQFYFGSAGSLIVPCCLSVTWAMVCCHPLPRNSSLLALHSLNINIRDGSRWHDITQ